MLEFRTATEIKPPDLIVFLHLIINTSEDPNATVPDPAGMVVPRHESPGSRPCPGLEVQVANVVQYTVVAGLASTNVQLVVVNYCWVTGSATRYRAVQLRLCPVCGLEVEHYDIGEMLSVLVLSTKDQKLASLPQTCGVTHSHPRYVAIVVY
jgi:hypothetical protein